MTLFAFPPSISSYFRSFLSCSYVATSPFLSSSVLFCFSSFNNTCTVPAHRGGKIISPLHCLLILNQLYRAVLLEKQTGSQLVTRFPAFYGTRRFITSFTTPRHLSLSWARSIQSMPPYPTSWRSFNIILPPTPRSSKWSLSLRFPHQSPAYTSPLPPYVPHAEHKSLSSSLSSLLKPLLPWPS